VAGAGDVGAAKALEGVRQELGGETGSVVGHLDRDHSRAAELAW
jgi:hypothetical protein